jgi:hypothetical protein
LVEEVNWWNYGLLEEDKGSWLCKMMSSAEGEEMVVKEEEEVVAGVGDMVVEEVAGVEDMVVEEVG